MLSRSPLLAALSDTMPAMAPADAELAALPPNRRVP
jgi:hypothetical protein